MILAHLPCGYLCTTLLATRLQRFVAPRWLMFWGLAGSVAPDIDLLWFYLIDHGTVHHHRYFTHWPLFWFTLVALGLLLHWHRPAAWKVMATVFSLNASIHLLLDTVVGDIWWGAPLLDHPVHLFEVSNRYRPWLWNFILHGSFFLELAIVLSALGVWYCKRKVR